MWEGFEQRNSDCKAGRQGAAVFREEEGRQWSEAELGGRVRKKASLQTESGLDFDSRRDGKTWEDVEGDVI